MPLIGAASLRIGTVPATRAYLGTALVWQAAGPRVDIVKTGGAIAVGAGRGTHALPGLFIKAGGGTTAAAGGSATDSVTRPRTGGAVAVGAGTAVRFISTGFGADRFGAGLFGSGSAAALASKS